MCRHLVPDTAVVLLEEGLIRQVAHFALRYSQEGAAVQEACCSALLELSRRLCDAAELMDDDECEVRREGRRAGGGGCCMHGTWRGQLSTSAE